MVRQKDKVTAAMLIAVLIAVACTTTGSAAAKSDSASHWGKRKAISHDRLQTRFADPDMIYAPFTFWFWDGPIKADKAAALT